MSTFVFSSLTSFTYSVDSIEINRLNKPARRWWAKNWIIQFDVDRNKVEANKKAEIYFN